MKKQLLKTMLLLFALIAGSSSAWAENNVSTVSTKFTATGNVTSNFKQTGDNTSAVWNLDVTWKDANKTYWGELNSTKGAQIGSGSNPASSVVLTGTGISGTITSVVVNTSMASGGTITVAVSVGSTAFECEGKTTASLTNSAANYEFTGSASGNVVITWSQPSTSKAIYIKSITTTYATGEVVTTPVFSPAGGTYTSAQNVSISCTTDGSTIYYTTDGSIPTTSSTAYTGAIAVSSTTTIKAIATKAGMNNSAVASAVYTIVEPAKLPFNWAGGGSAALTALDGVLASGLGGDYGSTHNPYNIKLDNDGDYIVFYTDKQPTKVTMGVKMVGGAATSKITVQESANNVDFTDVQELTISGKQNDILILETTSEFAATTRAIKLVFTKGSNVGVGPISIFSEDDVAVTINATGWATFYNANAHTLDFTGTGLTPYVAKPNTSSVTLRQITKVPEWVGIVVNAAGAGKYAIPKTAETGDDVSDNELRISNGTNTTTEYKNVYALASKGDPAVVGFYLVKAGVCVPAGKCFFALDPSGAPEFLGFEGETTSISTTNFTNDTNKSGEYYNLAGQRVAQPTKGLYIVNGKKVIIK